VFAASASVPQSFVSFTNDAKIADLYLGDRAQVRLNDHTLSIRSPTHRSSTRCKNRSGQSPTLQNRRNGWLPGLGTASVPSARLAKSCWKMAVLSRPVPPVDGIYRP